MEGTFDSYVFKVSLKSFGAFPIFTTLYLENGWFKSETDDNLGLRDKYLLYTWYFYRFSMSF